MAPFLPFVHTPEQLEGKRAEPGQVGSKILLPRLLCLHASAIVSTSRRLPQALLGRLTLQNDSISLTRVQRHFSRHRFRRCNPSLRQQAEQLSRLIWACC
jgi:hypothetical protein